MDPNDSFYAFDKKNLIRLSQLYQDVLLDLDRVMLDNWLDTYIIYLLTNSKFLEVKGISGIAQNIVETKNNILIG